MPFVTKLPFCCRSLSCSEYSLIVTRYSYSHIYSDLANARMMLTYCSIITRYKSEDPVERDFAG